MPGRAIFLSLLVLSLARPVTASEIVDAEDLRAAAAGIAGRPLPIMLEFAARHCSYCALLEAEIIEPMLKHPATGDQVLIRRLDLDSPRQLLDFDGRPATAAELAGRYAVDLTPTLLFVDGRGREIAPRLVGVYSLDYYGGIVDARIAEAAERLRTWP